MFDLKLLKCLPMYWLFYEQKIFSVPVVTGDMVIIGDSHVSLHDLITSHRSSHKSSVAQSSLCARYFGVSRQRYGCPCLTKCERRPFHRHFSSKRFWLKNTMTLPVCSRYGILVCPDNGMAARVLQNVNVGLFTDTFQQEILSEKSMTLPVCSTFEPLVLFHGHRPLERYNCQLYFFSMFLPTLV